MLGSRLFKLMSKVDTVESLMRYRRKMFLKFTSTYITYRARLFKEGLI